MYLFSEKPHFYHFLIQVTLGIAVLLKLRSNFSMTFQNSVLASVMLIKRLLE